MNMSQIMLGKNLVAEEDRSEVWTSVMVNFVCQTDWVTVPRYVAKHSSECSCEGIFG